MLWGSPWDLVFHGGVPTTHLRLYILYMRLLKASIVLEGF